MFHSPVSRFFHNTWASPGFSEVGCAVVRIHILGENNITSRSLTQTCKF